MGGKRDARRRRRKSRAATDRLAAAGERLLLGMGCDTCWHRVWSGGTGTAPEQSARPVCSYSGTKTLQSAPLAPEGTCRHWKRSMRVDWR